MFCFVCLFVFYHKETCISWKLRINFDSTETFIPEDAWFNGQYHYLTDTCSKDLTEEIVANFKSLLLGSSFGQHICQIIPGCENNVNVDVSCGEQTRRRRDSAAVPPLSVNFALKAPLSNYSSNTLLDQNETSLQISNDILAALEPAASLNITGFVLVVDTTRPPEIHLASFVCGDGQVLIGTKCGKDSKIPIIIVGKAPETVRISFLLTPRM